MRSATRNQIGKDPAYRWWIEGQPCICCQQLIQLQYMAIAAGAGPQEPYRQQSRTECAHLGVRGLSQKCSDLETLPLCGLEHHREGPHSAHKLQRGFTKHWKFDLPMLFAWYWDRYEEDRVA